MIKHLIPKAQTDKNSEVGFERIDMFWDKN